MCVFSYISSEFKTGDISVEGSEEYADYRKQLLSWEECEPLIKDYCLEMNLPTNKKDFIIHLKNMLKKKASLVDKNYPKNSQLIINEKGESILKRTKSTRNTAKIQEFKRQLEKYMPERNIMEILCNVEHWLNYTKNFGHISGSEPKLHNPKERYIILIFGYGSNMGPAQTSKHIRQGITPHMIHFTNKRHINEEKLDRAITDIINCYNKFSLPKLWGDIKVAAADGTKIDLYEQNLLSEYHIRYGGYGGVAYHHVSDTYIALFSHFIPCGVWEAVYIIDALLKNKSDIQPDTIHADTQGQSTPVFALTYLLRIQLMPRIRNWKNLKFYKAEKNLVYKHIESLFKDTINWDIIETHYQDLFQIILSIKTGKILPSTLLRKLNNYSRKNKLYQAFRELGNIIRTVYLLDFISNTPLRERITERTNKVEAYHGFSKWFFFGGEGIICENDPEEQSKIIKYNNLLSNAVILHNVIDISIALKKLNDEGIILSIEDIKALSPYMTKHIKRFGEYIVNLDEIPEPIKQVNIEEIIKSS
ncbi:Tn3 family transposase [Anaerophilus nitritogenes]|uniref:Tn3 family transposase n=1 Tax=Anaerophilus nitritogenes TaxID=2498136 RepID=UPI001930F06F|nr:Tn3 family transposase [Anaerophilus nitritogenes]